MFLLVLETFGDDLSEDPNFILSPFRLSADAKLAFDAYFTLTQSRYRNPETSKVRFKAKIIEYNDLPKSQAVFNRTFVGYNKVLRAAQFFL